MCSSGRNANRGGMSMVEKAEIDSSKGIATAEQFRKDVIEAGICSGCGACVVLCRALGGNVLGYDQIESSLPIVKNAEACTGCGLCYSVCPRFEEFEPPREERAEDDFIGEFRRFEILRATDPEIQEYAQNGGVVTEILKFLMESHYIDGAIVSTVSDDWLPHPRVVHNFEELKESLGTRYSVSPNPLILELLMNEPGEHQYPGYNDQKYAFVGTPCMCKAVQNMRWLNIGLARKISLVIGLFCYENFNYKEIIDRLEEKSKKDLKQWEKLHIKGKMHVYIKGEEKPIVIDMKELHDIVRGSCNICQDLTNFEADLAIGGIGAPQGYNSVFIRTKAGEKAIDFAVKKGKLGGIPEIGPAREEIYSKALRSINFVAKRKITTNRQNIEEKK